MKLYTLICALLSIFNMGLIFSSCNVHRISAVIKKDNVKNTTYIDCCTHCSKDKETGDIFCFKVNGRYPNVEEIDPKAFYDLEQRYKDQEAKKNLEKKAKEANAAANSGADQATQVGAAGADGASAGK